jgi:hypothetical protein
MILNFVNDVAIKVCAVQSVCVHNAKKTIKTKALLLPTNLILYEYLEYKFRDTMLKGFG